MNETGIEESNSERRLEVLKELPPLMPQFLRERRVGLPAVAEIAVEAGLARPELFTLLQMDLVRGSYGTEGITRAELRAYNPYQVIDSYAPHIVSLEAKGLVSETPDGVLRLSPEAQAAVEHLHKAAIDYISAMRPLPPATMDTLAGELERAVSAVLSDPVLMPRAGSHLAGSRAQARYGSRTAALARSEQAVLDLWSARDDAHTSAWRSRAFEGPAFDLLSHIWAGTAGSRPALEQALAASQTPDDVESSLRWLIEQEYVEANDDVDLGLTPRGVLAREDIEHETDRIYFAPWPHTIPQAAWVRDTLRELVQQLPASRNG